MNANNANQASLQAEQKAHEPSMEDILASIRKIIADDDALPLSRRAAPPAAKIEPAEAAPAREEPRPEPLALKAPPMQPAPPLPATRGLAPLKPAPIPSLRELAQKLDDLPASLVRSPNEPAPLELRPSLGEPPHSEPPAPRPAPVLAHPTPAAPQPAATPTVSFEADGFVVPPLSFRASVPPPPVAAPAPVVITPAPVAPEPAPAEPTAEFLEVRPAAPPVAEPIAAREKRPVDIAAPEAARRSSPPPRASALPPARLDRVEPAMLSENSGSKVGAAFEALAESALLRDPEMVERMTREILRPMIKTWLDDNLPNVVERLVRAEIERVARGPKG